MGRLSILSDSKDDKSFLKWIFALFLAISNLTMWKMTHLGHHIVANLIFAKHNDLSMLEIIFHIMQACSQLY